MSEVTETMLGTLESEISSYDSTVEELSSVGCGCTDECQLGCAGSCIERCADAAR